MAMSRTHEVAAIAALSACALTLCMGLGSRNRATEADPAVALVRLSAALAVAGLERREDVVIEMNEREVAYGFSRRGCDGLLLVTVLPRTAQGWAHVAPRLDLSAFDVAYLYDGMRYARVPRLERLGDRLLSELGPAAAETLPRLTAVAEAGDCGLARSAVAVLEAFSRGQTGTADQAGAGLDTGEGSV